jgi:hypothetical protein
MEARTCLTGLARIPILSLQFQGSAQRREQTTRLKVSPPARCVCPCAVVSASRFYRLWHDCRSRAQARKRHRTEQSGHFCFQSRNGKSTGKQFNGLRRLSHLPVTPRFFRFPHNCSARQLSSSNALRNIVRHIQNSQDPNRLASNRSRSSFYLLVYISMLLSAWPAPEGQTIQHDAF